MNKIRSVRVHDDVWARLEDVAAETNKSVSVLIREALEAYLAHVYG